MDFLLQILILFTLRKNCKATKITSDWYLWMHHTIDKIPNETDKQRSYFINGRKNT